MAKRVRALLVCCVAALGLWGAAVAYCAAEDHAAAAAGTPKPAQLAVGAPTGDEVLASFAGAKITVADLQAAIANKDPATRQRLATSEGRQGFLRELETYDLLTIEAERRGYAGRPVVSDAMHGAAIDALLTSLQVQPEAIAAEDVAHAFELQRAAMVRPALRRARHIELDNEGAARALLLQLKGASTVRFSEIAFERSSDAQTRRDGGDLGFFDHTGKPHSGVEPAAHGVAPELVAAAFAQKRIGDLSLVTHGGRFSVLMFTAEKPAADPRLSDVEGMLRKQLAVQRFEDAKTELLKRLYAEHPPELHPELLDAITLDAPEPTDQPSGFPAAPPDPRAPVRTVEPDGF